MDGSLIAKSHKLARLLRHDTTYHFPENGWRSVEDLILFHGFTIEELNTIVSEDEKGRYEFSDDRNNVRARYGHTVPVNPDLTIGMPPNILYHGTAMHLISSIKEHGICRQKRNYVHLSLTEEMATKVGSRHGKPVVIVIDAERMVKDGILFFQAKNGIWLTEYVDYKYCREYGK